MSTKIDFTANGKSTPVHVFWRMYCGSFHHVTNVISKKNEARDQLVSPTKINKKKREGDHITETMV